MNPGVLRSMSMRNRIMKVTVFIGVLLGAAACATSEDWSMWRAHNTHFASGEHGFFSMRNHKDGSDPKVSRSDVENSRQESWWGVYAVNVSQAQIFQN
jgi:hypothetical protein